MTMINSAVSAIVSALQAAPAVSTRVERVRLRALPTSAQNAVVVRPLGSDVQDAELPTGYPYVWNTAIAVECYARVPQGSAPDATVDSLVSSVYGRLMNDPTLSGDVVVLQPQSIQYEYDVNDEPIVCAILTINARQKTAGASL